MLSLVCGWWGWQPASWHLRFCNKNLQKATANLHTSFFSESKSAWVLLSAYVSAPPSSNALATALPIPAAKVASVNTFMKGQKDSLGWSQLWRRVSSGLMHQSVKEPCNYRPISRLPMLSKILGNKFLNALYEFLRVNDLLSSRQSGLHNQHSCETALIQISDKWFNSQYNGEYTSVFFIDLCKALFDLVDHSILLQKLNIHQSHESALKWLSLIWVTENRSSRLTKASPLNSLLPMVSHKVQLLGPLFFLIFVNDLSLYTTVGSAHIFADDTATSTSYCKGKGLQTVNCKLWKEADNVDIWCMHNKMITNTDKTNCTIVACQPKHK